MFCNNWQCDGGKEEDGAEAWMRRVFFLGGHMEVRDFAVVKAELDQDDFSCQAVWLQFLLPSG